jgi:polysaccharide biosynthesis protein VpsQ
MKYLAFTFSLFIIGVVFLADMGRLGILGFLNRIPFGDKIGHFLLYGLLTLLIDLALFRSRPDLRPGLVAFRVALTLALLIGLEEYSQQFFANRSFDLVDLAFSCLGLIFFSWVALKTQGRAAARPSKVVTGSTPDDPRHF